MRPRLVAPLIRMDRAGSGYFGAPRGDHEHRGVDYLCQPYDLVYSPVEGIVSYLGYPYRDDHAWRYVEITDDALRRHRIYYCVPAVRLDQIVLAGEVIGEAQDITERYPDSGMKPHLHLEIIAPGGDYLNPEEFNY